LLPFAINQPYTALPLFLPENSAMGVNSILKIFLPKDRVFFQLFENVAEELVKMGEKLKDVVNEPDFDKRAQLIYRAGQKFYHAF
jgi:uncharacterized membrane protein YfbV (UPF0208 family)